MPTPDKPFERLLLTGAAGGLGRVLRPRLRHWRMPFASPRVELLRALVDALGGA